MDNSPATVAPEVLSGISWIAANWKGIIAVGTGLLFPFFKRWVSLELKALKASADEAYQPKQKERTDEERKQRINSMAREVLSTEILAEFAKSTVAATLKGPEFFEAVECIPLKSLKIQQKIDDRIEHKWNNFHYELDAMIEKKISAGIAPIMAQLAAISEKITDMRINCANGSACKEKE